MQKFAVFAKLTQMTKSPSRLPQGRSQLVRVLSAAGDVIHVDDVVAALQLDRTAAAQRLSRWVEQGWLSRVGRGAYVAASIDTMGSDRVLDDPWVLVPALFAPAYIGGRTAAEHWDLTEQIFKDILVMTAQAVRQKRQERHGTLFSLKHIDERKLFGTKSVWRHQTRVPVSDVHRTIIDMLDDPAIGGGIQHLADCLAAYLRRGDRDDEKLIEYAVRLANGAVFKRLGFLAERSPEGAALARLCEHHLSGGHAKLDPAQDGPHVVTKWRLRVPPSWAREGTT
ncbi:type IV toxin-antitoxin system AbiEi family antitoxin domain-containing protein [Mesorhizobium sp. L-2-11]|uniref:type IV toxin-antitoxin system AbiEi family antitoxin domain-containing protein n=1 Tax=Mesorhizobium sp. L-2-11 TaxID=2744521 RepID=UPI001FD3E476|nr:type IV toxin-antitoxin system AbiEi family antitoxin domain-containing protein [Mesorhizobium sp. L-2-11]